ncbi:hypothetical protein PENTCL1PPCAC_18929, partial [Pristionchus entomophagus]
LSSSRTERSTLDSVGRRGVEKSRCPARTSEPLTAEVTRREVYFAIVDRKAVTGTPFPVGRDSERKIDDEGIDSVVVERPRAVYSDFKEYSRSSTSHRSCRAGVSTTLDVQGDSRRVFVPPNHCVIPQHTQSESFGQQLNTDAPSVDSAQFLSCLDRSDSVSRLCPLANLTFPIEHLLNGVVGSLREDKQILVINLHPSALHGTTGRSGRDR